MTPYPVILSPLLLKVDLDVFVFFLFQSAGYVSDLYGPYLNISMDK